MVGNLLRIRILPLALGAVLGISVLFGPFSSFENGLRSIRDAIRDKDASGELHVVEIDAHSLQRINRWPWPRSEHARIVAALADAGARSIAFDVDFSSYSTAKEDSALADALIYAGGSVILPTFRQVRNTRRNDMVESLPIPILREHSFLGAVSILPDRDGYVRRAPMGIVTSGTPRPSLSAILAGLDGSAFTDFKIDFAIDPDSIPRHSFVDVAYGGQTSALAGKDILIGATAVEMGDRYAVPRQGVIPGVIIQALATETLRNGMPRDIPAPILLIFGLMSACWCVRALRIRQVALRAGTVTIAALAALTISEELLSVTSQVVPLLIALWSSACARAILISLAKRRAAARRDIESGLPNRRLFVETTENKTVVAGLIDRYDEVTASLGSERMGRFIARLAERIAPAIDEVVYRIDDRILAWSTSVGSLESTMDRLRILLLHPVEIDGRRIDVRMALGVAASENREISDTLNVAMATASKALERGAFWTDGSVHDDDSGLDTLSLMGELDDAIERGEIEVHYQPKLALATDRIESAEALVRWKHKDHGYIRPDLFIPLAERHNRIDRLTLAITETVLQALANFRSLSIAVNLSAKLVIDDRFNCALNAVLDSYPQTVRRLIFEITETTALTEMDEAVNRLTAYRKRGISISMDDYGTGQSTLSYLRELPLSELKIDRMFVQNAHINHSDAVLVRSTIELAQQLGVKVVAEGVEDQECLDFLRSCNCDYAQGWLVSKPLSLGEFSAFISDRAKAA